MIKITDLIYQYPHQPEPTLNHLNLEIATGEFISIVAASGEGKTTLAKLLNGLLTPTSGKIEINGLETSSSSQVIQLRQNVGVIFSDVAEQFIGSTVLEELAFGLENLQIAPQEIRTRINWALSITDLMDLKSEPLKSLTEIQKKKLLLVSFLVMQPSVLVLDNYLTDLTSTEANQLWDIIKKLPLLKELTLINLTSELKHCPEFGKVLSLKNHSLVQGNQTKQFEETKFIFEANESLNVPPSSQLFSNLERNIDSKEEVHAYSVLHRINPSLKIISLLCLVIGVMSINQPLSLIFWFLIILGISRLAKISPTVLFKSLKSAAIFILTAAFLVLLSFSGKKNSSFLPFSIYGLNAAVIVMLKIIILVISSVIFTKTTTALEAAKGMEGFFKPLHKLGKFQTLINQFGIMFALALRFIPIIMEEAELLLQNRTNQTQNFFQKAQRYLEILLPLLVNCLEKADHLAIAMEARAYHPALKRSSYQNFKITKKDLISCFALIILLVLSVILERFLL